MGGDASFELPDYFAVFRVILKGAKCLLGVVLDVKLWVANERLAVKLCTQNSLRHVIAKRALGASFWSRNEVTPNSDEYTVRLNNSCGRLGRSVDSAGVGSATPRSTTGSCCRSPRWSACGG